MHPLNVYGYHVRYGNSTKKEENYDIHESVCFSSLFNSNCKSKYYRIIILKGDADLEKYHSNYCFFNKKQIKNHLKQIPKFCNIQFTVDDTVYNGDDAYQLDFYIDSNNRRIHKYVLTWIRSLFEWPFNYYLVHAKELKKLPEFKFESIINLFNVVATVHKDNFNSNIHTFGTGLGLLKKSKIVNEVCSCKNGSVNSVFPRFIGNKKIPQCNLPSNFEDIIPALFEINLPKYIEAYHIIKENEDNNNRN